MLYGALDVQYVPSSNPLVDCLTKPLIHNSRFYGLNSEYQTYPFVRGGMLEKNAKMTMKAKLDESTMLEASHQEPRSTLETL